MQPAHWLRSRTWRYGSNAVILTAAVIAIVAFVNVLADQWHWRWDVTANKEFTLSPQTRSVLGGLEEPVKAYAFLQPGYEATQIENLLKEYALQSDLFSYEVIDPNKNPGMAQKFDINMFNTVVFEAGEETRKVYSFDIFGYSQETQMQQFQGEQAFTSAIREVTEGTAGTIYFLTAHGERNLNMEYRSVRSYLEGEGYTVEELNIAEAGGVPNDASVVVLAGPQRDYTSPELEALNTYLRGGGSLMLLLDPPGRGQPLPSLLRWLEQWGIEAQQDLVVDPESHYFVDALSLIPQWEYHETTKDLMAERVGIVIPRARSLATTDDAPEGYQLTRLLKTSDAAWGEVEYAAERFQQDEADHEGPLALAYMIEPEPVDTAQGGAAGAAEAAPSPARARIFVAGSAAWPINDVLTFQGNLDFFVNTVNWLAGKQDMITIRPKTPEFRQVRLTGQQAAVIFYGTVVVLPLLALVGGGLVWWRRRHL